VIVEYIRYQIPEEQETAFRDAYAGGQVSLHKSPHCLGWEVTRCVEEPTSWVVRIEWDSVEGHVNGFRKSAEFGSFLTHVRPFVANIQEMRHYELIGIASSP
jgi:heme-degrading monooxygenase HmoA